MVWQSWQADPMMLASRSSYVPVPVTGSARAAPGGLLVGCGVADFMCHRQQGHWHFDRPAIQPLPATYPIHKHSKTCKDADLGYREIQVEAPAGDVITGAGGAAGQAPGVGHQPPGDTRPFWAKQLTYSE